MLVKTLDDKILEIEPSLKAKCGLFKDLEKLKESDTLPILVNSSILNTITEFSKTDTFCLDKNYNPLEIYFSDIILETFKDFETKYVIDVLDACNYLQYDYLMELTAKILSFRLKDLGTSKKLSDYGDYDRHFSWMQ